MSRSIIRLKDIAAVTGFSVNTISLALRGSLRIPDETRAQISTAAEKLNYLPNHVAKSLVSRQSKTIGLILTDVTNPVLTHVAQAIEASFADRGYATLFATSDNDAAKEVRVIETFLSRQVDGIMIYPCNHRKLETIRKLRERSFPIVLLVGDPDAGIDAVCMDERRGAYKATKHLISLGNKRIGIIDSSTALGNSEKLDGFKQALQESKIAFDSALQVDPRGHSVLKGYRATETLLSLPLPPTAIFAANDSLALGVMRYCSKNNIAIPSSLAVIGFDNIEFGEFAATSLSSICYDVDQITYLAVERMMKLINAEQSLPPPRVTLIDPEIVVRESTVR